MFYKALAQQRISELERRYISLLEARIAELEDKVAQDSKSKGSEDVSLIFILAQGYAVTRTAKQEAKKTKPTKDSPNGDQKTDKDEKVIDLEVFLTGKSLLV